MDSGNVSVKSSEDNQGSICQIRLRGKGWDEIRTGAETVHGLVCVRAFSVVSNHVSPLSGEFVQTFAYAHMLHTLRHSPLSSLVFSDAIMVMPLEVVFRKFGTQMTPSSETSKSRKAVQALSWCLHLMMGWMRTSKQTLNPGKRKMLFNRDP